MTTPVPLNVAPCLSRPSDPTASPDRITPKESSLIDHLNIIPTGY